MDTPLTLDFEMAEAEKDRYYRRQAEFDAQMRVVGTAVGLIMIMVIGVAWGIADGWAEGSLALLFLIPLAVGILLWRPSTARSLEQLKKSSTVRLGLRFAQRLSVDANGIQGARRGLLVGRN